MNQDYKDILQNLLENNVEFLVVGAYALAAHGFPRATGDIDIFVNRTSDNSKKVYQAIQNFGAPLGELNDQSFTEAGVIYQIGVAPRRIDIITDIDGIDFQSAWENKIEIKIGDILVPVISKTDLIKNKKASARDKDKLDIKILENN